MTKSALTASQLRKLPWPRALLAKQPLSVDDCYQIGQIVVERVQQGASPRLRGRKPWSMRRVRQELGLASAAAFTRCVQVYEVASELGLKRPIQGVSASTLFLIASLPKEGRVKAAKRVIKERWSKRRIEIEFGNQLAPKHTGRPKGLACIKALSRCVSRPLTMNLDQTQGLEQGQRKVALQQVQQLTNELNALRKHLAATIPQGGRGGSTAVDHST